MQRGNKKARRKRRRIVEGVVQISLWCRVITAVGVVYSLIAVQKGRDKSDDRRFSGVPRYPHRTAGLDNEHTELHYILSAYMGFGIC
jgi:hypothetical protein